jgi:hypothetical protein
MTRRTRRNAPVYGSDVSKLANALRPVASRTSFAPATLSAAGAVSQIGRSNGTDTSGNYRLLHAALVGFHAPRLVYTNAINNNGSEADGANSITVRASIEYPTGTFFPVWFNGKRDVVIEPGATVTSDPVGFSAGPAILANFYTRTYVSVASAGMTWPLGQTAATNEGGEHGTSITDKTTTGTITATYERLYGPAAILGIPEQVKPFVAIVGDSIAAGYNDTYDNSFLVQALVALGIPFINLAAGSEVPSKWGANSGRLRRAPLLQYCTHVIFEDGINGLGTTWANIQTNQQAAWDYLNAQGLKVIQTTITPQTTSTDTWKSTTNQTKNANESLRLQLNALIRTKPTPLWGIVEVADIAETARDSGYWNFDGATASKWTSDGTHPSPYAHSQISTGIQSQLSALLA